MTSPRQLTHDEKKASEAAFRGLPQDESWTDSAKSVYAGIIQALDKNPPAIPGTEDTHLPTLPAAEEVSNASEAGDLVEIPPADSINPEEIPPDLKRLTVRLRREAVQSGILKDVTPLAQTVGLDFCVGLTNPLWQQYISSSPDLTEQHIHTRVRETLVAVRLRLVSLKEPTPLIDVPLLLEFSPEPTPQLCLAFALFHQDPVDGNCLLLIHPGEVFATHQAFENN